MTVIYSLYNGVNDFLFFLTIYVILFTVRHIHPVVVQENKIKIKIKKDAEMNPFESLRIEENLLIGRLWNLMSYIYLSCVPYHLSTNKTKIYIY